ncbi:helix-turn-helix transcriptional regulator [Billgrantia antri]|uniref:Helix-turn-helix transcriptional regulator n=1 Tax=Halomonas sulfidivorans TaxID=2733488 RepID=A0ABX7WLE1_9GAMM|nr:helix-turn-helix transcriptional regulator [Halomonas sulfidivorans]QTP60905.1 helix-turn-helix transcriptional regulator [Halomonas sulfidivorans]
MAELKVHASAVKIERMVHTDISRAEFSARLKEALEHAGFAGRGEGARLARAIKVTPKAVSKWLNGEARPGHDKLVQIADALRVRVEWLDYGKGPMTQPEIGDVLRSGPQAGEALRTTPKAGDAISRQRRHEVEFIGHLDAWDNDTPLGDDEVELPLFREVEVSGGSGNTQVIENHGAKLRFAKRTLRRAGVMEEHAACAYVDGDSMEPILPDGATVGVNTQDKAIKDGKMYVIDHGGLLRVKFLYRLPGGGLRIRSANPDREAYPDEDLGPDWPEQVRIIGKVFWYSVLMH